MKKIVLAFLFCSTAFAVPTALQLVQDQIEVIQTQQDVVSAQCTSQQDQLAVRLAQLQAQAAKISASPSPSPSTSH